MRPMASPDTRTELRGQGSNLALPGFNRPRRLQRFSPVGELVGLEGLEPPLHGL